MIEPTTLRMIAIAATVLGATGSLAIFACRTALRGLDIGMVPGHVLTRVRWWRSHAAPALHTSMTVMAVGLIGLLVI
jgi:hypothetical protein